MASLATPYPWRSMKSCWSSFRKLKRFIRACGSSFFQRPMRPMPKAFAIAPIVIWHCGGFHPGPPDRSRPFANVRWPGGRCNSPAEELKNFASSRAACISGPPYFFSADFAKRGCLQFQESSNVGVPNLKKIGVTPCKAKIYWLVSKNKTEKALRIPVSTRTGGPNCKGRRRGAYLPFGGLANSQGFFLFPARPDMPNPKGGSMQAGDRTVAQGGDHAEVS